MFVPAASLAEEAAADLPDAPQTKAATIDILAGIGRYGPWLKHGAAYVALAEAKDMLAVGLNRAVMLVDTA